MDRKWAEIIRLRFDGPRFREHGIELSVLPELYRFQEIVTLLAEALWHQDNPHRKRLPRGFDQTVRLRFRSIDKGSATIPLEAPQPHGQLDLLSNLNYPERAAELAYRTVRMLDRVDSRPLELPDNVISLFADWGNRLSPNEYIGLKVPDRKIDSFQRCYILPD